MKKLLSILLALAMLCAAAYAEPENAEATAGEAPVEGVLDALGEDAYRAAYRALSEGSVIRSGSRGDVAWSVQQTLIAFGQQIEADGSIGPRTLGALNAVQRAFGLDETEALDAAGYARLLSRLLILTDEETARGLLEGALGDEYEYARGCALLIGGRNFLASEAFRESGFGDWEARAASCAMPWPETGTLWKSGEIRGSDTELRVKVNAPEDRAALVKVYTPDGAPVASLFIGGTGEAAARLPAGEYAVRYGAGTEWFGAEDAFGGEGSYRAMTFGEGSKAVGLQSGRSYTITVNADADDPGDGVGTEEARWSDF